MHPYAIDRMVQERREELTRLGQADSGARAARRARARGPGRLRSAWMTAVAARIGRSAPYTRPLDPCPRPQMRP
ncbi:MAG TPA: hypothetical protein VHF27_14405 [Acidimicrobiales bacterium]|nr:hypothetical protein [Acidimicrobiales bacterium]